MKKPISCAIVVTVSALTALSNVETTWAGPLPLGTAGLKTAAASDIVDVRYRRHHRRYYRRNEAIAAGIVFGLLGATIASRYYDDYDEPYYYSYPSYGYYGGGGHYRSHYGGHYRHQGRHIGAHRAGHHRRH
jgi:hypothetical protein